MGPGVLLEHSRVALKGILGRKGRHWLEAGGESREVIF